MTRSKKRRDRARARVLLIIESLPLSRDHRLRKQAGALAAAGYDVTVICRRDERNRMYAEAAGVRLLEFVPPAEGTSKIGFLWEYGYSLAATFVLCLWAARRGRIDVMQIGNPPDAQFLLAMPFKPFGCSLIVDQRDLSPEVYVDRYGTDTGVLFRVISKLERWSWRTADHVITVNDSLVETVVERGNKSPESVSVVGNGPRGNPTPTPRPDLKQGKKFLVMWLGLMGPQDHVDLTLEAAHHVVKTFGRSDCHFAFVGDGEALAGLRSLASELDIESFVTFAGWLEEPQCLEYLSTADLGLDSNLQQEVTPVKGLEYMLLGMPMVAFDLNETRRMAGDAAAYVEPGDSLALATTIVELLDDPARMKCMGEIGRKRIDEKLSWDRQETQYLDVYSSLVSNSSRMDPRADFRTDPPTLTSPTPSTTTPSSLVEQPAR